MQTHKGNKHLIQMPIFQSSAPPNKFEMFKRLMKISKNNNTKTKKICHQVLHGNCYC